MIPKIENQTVGNIQILGLEKVGRGHRALCRCGCGKEFTAIAALVLNGKVKSCGCRRRYNLLGQVFGDLTVLEPIASIGIRTGMWKCLCSCGKESAQPTTPLVQGRIKSCGCKQFDVISENRKKAKGHSGANNAYSQYRAGARRRKIEFAVTFDQFKEIVTKDCFYCGSVPSRVVICGNSPNAAAKKHSAFVCNGLDRIDSSLGYTLDNILPCCSTCNYAKQDLKQDYFMQWIARAYTHLYGRPE